MAERNRGEVQNGLRDIDLSNVQSSLYTKEVLAKVLLYSTSAVVVLHRTATRRWNGAEGKDGRGI